MLCRSRRWHFRAESLPAEERKARARKLKESTAARIREILTPDQRARYDRVPELASADGKTGVGGRVWVLDADGEPRPVALTLGITDGSSTEVLKGDVKEGQAVSA